MTGRPAVAAADVVVELCDCCVWAIDGSGPCCVADGHDGPQPMGMLAADPTVGRVDVLGTGSQFFSWRPCSGCGDRLGGMRTDGIARLTGQG